MRYPLFTMNVSSRLFLLMSVILLSSGLAHGTGKIIKGTVLFPDSLQYPYSVTLLQDSTAKRTLNFSDAPFSIQSQPDADRLKISSFGYESVDIPIPSSSSDTVAIQPIRLTAASSNLDEVVVSGKKAVIKSSGMNFTISNLQNTYITNAGSLIDMLKWTPGISVDGHDNISVVGRGGSPLIYLNGIQVSNQAELSAIIASNVSKIEVLRDPGSEYPMGTPSVILITTVKPIGEYVNLELRENAKMRNKFSNTAQASVYGNIKRVNFYAYVSDVLSNSDQNADYILQTFNKSGDIDMTQILYEGDKISGNRLQWFAGATYNTKYKSSILLQYFGSYAGKQTRSFETDRTVIRDGESVSDHYTDENKSHPKRHRLTAAYNTPLSGGTLKVRAFFHYTQRSTDQFYESESHPKDLSSVYDYTYRLWTLQGDYSHKLKKLGSHSFGFYTGYTDNDMNLDDYRQGLTQKVDGDSRWAELYYSINGKLKKFGFRAGLRGRYEHNSTTEAGQERRTQSYTNVSPNAMVSYNFSDSYSLNASYNLSYGLPSFRDLNPALRLSNQIFYDQGNPDLKKSIHQRVNVSANLSDFNVYSELYFTKDPISNITEPYGDGMFLTHPINMKNESIYILGTEYSAMPVKGWRIYASASGGWSTRQYPFLDSMVKSCGWFGTVYLDTSYSFGPFSIFFSGVYGTPRKIDNVRTGYVLSLDAGVECSLLKNRLNLRLEGEDLAARGVTPSWKSYSPYLYQYRRNRYDTRGVTFSITYKFSPVKRKFRMEGTSADNSRIE